MRWGPGWRPSCDAAGRCGAVRPRRNARGHGARSRRRAQSRSPRPRARPGRPRRAAFLVVARRAGPASRRDGYRSRASRLWRAARRVAGALRGGALRGYETVRGCGHAARRHRSALAQVGNRAPTRRRDTRRRSSNGWGSTSAPWRSSAATRHLFPSRTRRRCWRRRASSAWRLPRCVYVGDAERDVTAGIAAGMRTIVARYGYIEAHESPDTWPADGNIDNPAALLGWLPVGR